MFHRQESGTDLKNGMREKYYKCDELFKSLSDADKKKYQKLMDETRKAFIPYVTGTSHSATHYLPLRDKLEELHKQLHNHKFCDNPVPSKNATRDELNSFFKEKNPPELFTSEDEEELDNCLMP